MGTLILKSENSLNSNVLPLDYKLYKNRVLADGGVIVNEQKTIDAFKYLSRNGIQTSEVFTGVSPSFGAKFSSSGVLQKLYTFGSDDGGDIIVTITNTSLGYVENELLKIGGTNSNTYKSKKPMLLGNSVGVFVKAKLKEFSAYSGSQAAFGLATLANLGNSIATLSFEKAGASTSEFKVFGKYNNGTVSRGAGTFGGAFNTKALFASTSGGSVIDYGVIVSSVTNALDISAGEASVHLATLINSSSFVTLPAIAEFSEFWVLKDTKEQSVMAISKR